MQILNNGISIPSIGFGTYKLPDTDAGTHAVTEAARIGYRLFDGARAYANERAVGRALRQCGIPRSDLFVTSKVWSTDSGYDGALRAAEEALADLGLDYLDLFLIHWPATPSKTPLWEEKNLATWRAMERLVDEGTVRAIGLSNFYVSHLMTLMACANIPPSVDQLEYNPGCRQAATAKFCRENGIIIQAWSPLGRGRVFENPVIQSLSQKYGKSPAQICLRWEIEQGVIPIPKSSDPMRMKENFSALDFSISPSDINLISALPPFGQSGLDPDTNPPE